MEASRNIFICLILIISQLGLAEQGAATGSLGLGAAAVAGVMMVKICLT